MLHSSLLYLPDQHDLTPEAGIDWQQRFAVLAEQAQDPRLRAYYAAGMYDGQTPLREVRLMAMDVETTGLDPAKDEIISIGIVPMSWDRIRASMSRHWIIKPQAPLGDESITLHGITHSRVEHAPCLLDVLEPFLQAIAGHVLVVHCRTIERTFINNALNRLIRESLEMPMIDTMELEARVHRQPVADPRPWWQRLFKPRPYQQVSIRLADSRNRYGLPFYKPHHAVTDALATAELLQAQIAHRFSPDTRLDQLWH